MPTPTALAPRTMSAPSSPYLASMPLDPTRVAPTPNWAPRTAAGERAVRRRRARIAANSRPPSGVLPSTNRTAVLVSADRSDEFGEGRFVMGRWARLASTLTVLAAAVVVGIVLLSAGQSYGVGEVTVGPGDTLWSIAQRAEPEADPRSVVDRIRQLNGLDGDAIAAGTVLRVPTQR